MRLFRSPRPQTRAKPPSPASAVFPHLVRLAARLVELHDVQVVHLLVDEHLDGLRGALQDIIVPQIRQVARHSLSIGMVGAAFWSINN